MKTSESYIFLENVRFYARHGVAEQETAVGNTFIVNLKLRVDFSQASQTDDLSYTVSYADVYRITKEEMHIPSKLLEHVSQRIVSRLFRELPQVTEINIKLAKQNPPMGAQLDGAGVILHCSR